MDAAAETQPTSTHTQDVLCSLIFLQNYLFTFCLLQFLSGTHSRSHTCLGLLERKQRHASCLEEPEWSFTHSKLFLPPSAPSDIGSVLREMISPLSCCVFRATSEKQHCWDIREKVHLWRSRLIKCMSHQLTLTKCVARESRTTGLCWNWIESTLEDTSYYTKTWFLPSLSQKYLSSKLLLLNLHVSALRCYINSNENSHFTDRLSVNGC